MGATAGSLISATIAFITAWVNSRTMLRIKQIDQQMSDQKLILEIALRDHEMATNLMKEYAEKFGQEVNLYPAFPRMIFYKEMNELLKKNVKTADLQHSILSALENQSSLETLIERYNAQKGRKVA